MPRRIEFARSPDDCRAFAGFCRWCGEVGAVLVGGGALLVKKIA